MTGMNGSPDDNAGIPARRGTDRPFWALVAFLAYACMAVATIMLTSNGRSTAAVWPADAVILALLLSRPRSDWPMLLLAGALANLVGNGLTRGWAPGIIGLGAINMAQTALAAALLAGWGRRQSTRDAHDVMGDGHTIGRFLLCAGLIAPALGAGVGAVIANLAFAQPVWPSLVRWFTSNALGFVIFTPFFIAVFDGSYARAIETLTPHRLARAAALFAAHGAMLLLVFGQSRIPLLFLPFPTLLLLAFVLGRLATQAGGMLVALAGVLALAHHTGPLAPLHLVPGFAVQCYQVYLAVLLCTTLPVATIVASRTEARALLAEREGLLRLVMAHSPDAIIGLDHAGVCRWAAGPLRESLGLTPDALIGQPIAQIGGGAGAALARLYHDCMRDDRHTPVVELRPTLHPGITLEASLRIAPHDPGQMVGSVITLRDITVRKARETAISRRMEIDDLTGLLNRAGFRTRLARAIERSHEAAARPLTLALIDVDHFKAINDTHGHGVGDAALVEIARRLVAGTREGDSVGRLGGDEFGVLFDCDLAAARAIADRVVRLVAADPILTAGNVMVLASISCGLAACSAGMAREALFDSADLALYEAKRSGRNAVRSAA